MKRFFSLLLAVAMLATFAVPVSAASKNPVSGISSRGYLADEDNENRVDMSKTADRVPYGETVYFPLLSNGSGNLTNLQKAVDDAKKAVTAAEAELKTLTTDFNTKNGQWDAAVKALATATQNYTTATSAGNSKEALAKARTIAETALASAKAALAKLPNPTDKQVSDLLTTVNDTTRVYGDAAAMYNAVLAAQAEYDKPADSGTKAALLIVLNEKKAAWNKAKTDNRWAPPAGGTDADIIVMLKGKMDTAVLAHKKATGDQAAYKNANTLVTTKQREFDVADAAWKAAANPPSAADIQKLLELKNAATKKESDTKKLKDTAEGKVKAKQAEITNTLKPAVAKAEAALTAANGKSFPYVYESSAASEARVSRTKWEESGTYAGTPEVVKKKVADSKYLPNLSLGSDFIYFVAVPVKARSTTDSRDLLGELTVRQSKGEKWEFDLGVAVEIGYDNAGSSDSDGYITRKAQTFKRNNGFDEDTEYEFTFEADSNSSFVVNTVSQGSIVLSFNTDPIDRIYDKILKSYPNATVEFFNGNYESFNKTGTLYLAPPDGEDDYNVYAVDSKNNITRVTADWDSSADAYAIRTRTLGRYFLSSQRLSSSFLSSGSTSSSSSSTGSGSGTGTGTGSGSGGLVVVPPPVAPSKPASTPTLPASSKPASSAPPASSSQAPSSSETSSTEEEISEPMDDEASSEDIVDVDTDTDDTDAPEKGGSALVWVLAIVGLLAAGGAVAFVLYTNKIKRRDDGYSQYDEYDDENDFPDDDR